MKKLIIKLFIILLLVGSAGYVYQMKHPFPKNYRFLLMCSSFKRPMFLSGQIFRLMNQTYQNFDISVSVKGVDPQKSYETFEKEWRPLVKKKRLFLRYDLNRAQLSNLLDTVRIVNIEDYDYFCKIDDDDWYAPEYLESINNSLNVSNHHFNNEETNVTMSFTENAYRLWEDIDTTYIDNKNSNLVGPTICVSRKLLKILLEIEKDPLALKKYAPDEPMGLQYYREDRLIHHLGLKMGAESRYTEEPLVIYGQQYRSITRNDKYVR